MTRGSGAFVTYNHQILLFLRDDKPTIPEPNKWSIVGGYVEENESFDEGLLREIQEEISITPSTFHFLFSDHKDDHKVHIYHVPLTEEESQNIKLGDEGQEVRFVGFQALDTLPLTEFLKKIVTDKKELIRNLLEED
jgi:8-oxo-dGTP diphosphatase